MQGLALLNPVVFLPISGMNAYMKSVSRLFKNVLYGGAKSDGIAVM